MYDVQIQPLNGGCVKVQSSFSTHFVTILNTIIRLCILTFLVMMNLLFIFASVDYNIILHNDAFMWFFDIHQKTHFESNL